MNQASGSVPADPKNVNQESLFEKWEREDAESQAAILHDRWWPFHPFGGTEICPNSQTHETLAKFNSGAECARAIDCHNALIGVANPEGAVKLLIHVLQCMTDRYCELVNSGDAGRWDPEQDAEVSNARTTIALFQKQEDAQ